MEIDDCLQIDHHILNNGYPLEIHTVITEDYYILSLYRIRHAKKGWESTSARIKPPVLLMHGLFGSCCDFLLAENSLAYYLADCGFDVWLGNNRGTPFSKKHVHWDCEKDREKYWDFSYHEIGYYDLAAFIDKIVMETKLPKIFYIGNSQGTTIFFVLMSTRIEYNEKIQLAVTLATTAYGEHVSIIPAMDFFVIPYAKVLFSISGHLSLASIDNMRKFMRSCCSPNCWIQKITCSLVKKLISFVLTPLEDEGDLMYKVLAFSPLPVSAKQLIHYSQLRDKGIKVTKYFNYGPKKNLEVYGTAEPPLYQFNRISSPIIIFLGSNDIFGHPEDVNTLVKEIGPNAQIYWIRKEGYRHFDFLLAPDSCEMINKPIVEFLNRYSDDSTFTC